MVIRGRYVHQSSNRTRPSLLLHSTILTQLLFTLVHLLLSTIIPTRRVYGNTGTLRTSKFNSYAIPSIVSRNYRFLLLIQLLLQYYYRDTPIVAHSIPYVNFHIIRDSFAHTYQ